MPTKNWIRQLFARPVNRRPAAPAASATSSSGAAATTPTPAHNLDPPQGTDNVVEVAGEGFDTLDLSGGSAQGVYVDLARSADQLVGPGTLLFLGWNVIDAAVGTPVNDTILGNALANRIGGGDDILWGGVGNDKLRGDAGFDSLMGGADDDYLSGNSGNDTLAGGAGRDTLLGGIGYDAFVFHILEDLDTERDEAEEFQVWQ